MDAFAQALGESLTSALAAAATLYMWLWSLAGWRKLAHSPRAHLFRERAVAVSSGIGPCLLLTLLAMPAVRLVPPYAAAVLAAAAFCVHAALDPANAGFWHHRRLRPLGIAAALGVAVVLGAFLPHPELAPVVFAAAVFHRHQRSGVILTIEAYEDLEALRAKVVKVEADLRNGTGEAPQPSSHTARRA